MAEIGGLAGAAKKVGGLLLGGRGRLTSTRTGGRQSSWIGEGECRLAPDW